MKLIFCLDDECGVSLFGKRQSRDRYLCDDIVAECGNGTLQMSEYSAKLFPVGAASVCNAPTLNDSTCYFLEVENPEKYIKNADCVVIYRWNRLYPSDVKFNKDMSHFGFSLDSSHSFAGYSHEKITKEIYVRR